MSHRSSVSHGSMMPGSVKGPASSQRKRSHPSSIHCNNCVQPLVRTCFLCACDCVFCEECTFSHFEHNSDCPSCGKTLTENDFLEVEIADPNADDTPAAAKKRTVQALFTKRTNQTKELPYTDLCSSVCRQLDSLKMITTFLLKQLLKDSKMHGQKFTKARRNLQEMEDEMTQLKQLAASDRSQSQEYINDLEKRLKAREMEIAQYQQNYGASQAPSGARSSHRRDVRDERNADREPPFRGLMQQKQAQERAQEQSYRSSSERAPPMRHAAAARATSAPSSSFSVGRSTTNRMGMRGPYQPSVTPMQSRPDRPFSSNVSTGSTTSLGRPIRNLTANTSFKFTSHHINKRRRTSSRAGTPTTTFSPRGSVLSPSSAFMGGPTHHSRHHSGPSTSFHR